MNNSTQNNDDIRSSPRVSVIMPVYNGMRFIGQALDSALNQQFTDLEVIVVNDGSTDGSAEIVRDYLQKDPRVRYHEQANAGLCAARNAAIALARGEYLALLDCDDIWLPEHLKMSVAALDADPAVVMTHADVRFVDEDNRVVSEHLSKQRWANWAHDPFAAILLRHEHVPCPTAVFRTSICRRLGGFDMRYNYLGCEDRDMWLRLALEGKVQHLSYHGADYRVHATSMSRNHDKMLRARRILVERMREFPQGRELYRAARSAIELSKAELPAPRIHRIFAYLKAMRWSPLDKRNWRGLAATMLGRT